MRNGATVTETDLQAVWIDGESPPCVSSDLLLDTVFAETAGTVDPSDSDMWESEPPAWSVVADGRRDDDDDDEYDDIDDDDDDLDDYDDDELYEDDLDDEEEDSGDDD